MLQRVLEPEVMNTVSEAVDYNQMDHSQVNRVFVDDFLKALKAVETTIQRPIRIFDAGTGTALIPIELIGRGVDVIVTASDLADQMLLVGRQNVAAAGLDGRITLVLRDCKQLPDDAATYDAVMSNSIVHHIPHPREVIAELWRVLKPGGLLFIRDLLRPENMETLGRLVETYAATANQHQKQMFRDSLHAALNVSEMREILLRIGIGPDTIQATSDRHWTIAAYKPSASS